jgi:hypothetical protein
VPATGPGAVFSGRRPERGSSGESKGGVNLGDGGPDSGAVLPVSLPEVLVSLCRQFLGLAVVIWARHRSSRWSRCPALESYLSRRLLMRPRSLQARVE